MSPAEVLAWLHAPLGNAVASIVAMVFVATLAACIFGLDCVGRYIPADLGMGGEPLDFNDTDAVIDSGPAMLELERVDVMLTAPQPLAGPQWDCLAERAELELLRCRPTCSGLVTREGAAHICT